MDCIQNSFDRLLILLLVLSGELRVRDVVRPLREAAHADNSLAHHLWVLTFPIVWATLAERKEQQIALAKPIIVLLQREYHLRQSHQRPNVVQVCK